MQKLGTKTQVTTERSLLEGFLVYVSILLRYRWFIVITTSASTLGVIAFCVLTLLLPPEKSPLPNQFRAQAIIVMQQNGGSDIAASILTALGIPQNPGSPMVGFDIGDLAIQILRSRALLDQLIDEFDIVGRYHLTGSVRGKSRDLILKKSIFAYARNSGTITISFEDIDPVFARDFVNRSITLLDEWFAQNRGSTKQRETKLLEAKVSDVKREINILENKLKTLQNQYGVLNAQDLGVSQATTLADLRSQLILKEIEIKNYSSFSKIDDPKLQQLKEERQNILDLIQQIEGGIHNSQPSTSGRRSLPDIAQDFTAITLELDIQRRIYNTLSPQLEAAKLATETEPVFQVLEMAEVPDTKSGPQRSRIALQVILGAFVGSIALSFVLNFFRQVRRDPEKRKYLTGEL